MKKTGELKKGGSYPSKKVKVVSRNNWTMEIPINRTIYRFEPHGILELPKELIEHPDFIQQKAYFTVIED